MACGATFRGMVIGNLFFALLHEPIEFVGQYIDSGIHIRLHREGMDSFATNFQMGFGFLLQFLDGQYAMDVDDMVKMARDAFHFLLDVGAERIGNFYMMTRNENLHIGLLLLLL
jgi:hypothetical protein